MDSPGRQKVEGWFAGQGWRVFDFQREVWDAFSRGESGLIHSATGTGKTLAAWLGPVSKALDTPGPAGLRVLWLTPMRALAADTAESLRRPIDDLGLGWRVETRTGDTTATQRKRQTTSLPEALVTTPESLCLLFARANHGELFANLDLVVVDEWHELLSTKRGTQTELALAHLRGLVPGVPVWGVSATLGNTEEAGRALVGSGDFRLVRGLVESDTRIDTLLPDDARRFPWAGHYGVSMIPKVVQALEQSGTTLVFTNTRAQAEIWFQQILDARPEWKDSVALHHGSLDPAVRTEVERKLKEGGLRAVVSTSSLDLGVDFSPVDRVLQVGSPKGVARLLQRAGRSGHRPAESSHVTCVPTHALELIDLTAARFAAQAGKIEPRVPLQKPLDVLAQHLVTLALGDGFEEGPLLREVRTTFAYEDLTDEEWGWVRDFVVHGGSSLRAYPEYHKVVEKDGRFVVEDEGIAARHRMSIGTIVSDASMVVRTMKGGTLGTVEESFIARLSAGDRFLFGGKPWQFVRIKDMTAWVKPARTLSGAVPRWAGGRLPLSSELAESIRQELDFAKHGELRSPEMQALAPLLEVQSRWSAIPGADEILVESVEDREGHHLFVFPIEGRLVHEGLAALLAYRLAQDRPTTFSMAANDYGFELLSETPATLHHGLFSTDSLFEDIAASLNSVEMAKRQFREIARVAGLVFQGYPGAAKTMKQVQVSSGLLYDVFSRYDPENMLLNQAYREVRERQLEQTRLAKALERIGRAKLVHTTPPRPTPLGLPILVDRLRETLSTETLADRIEAMVTKLEQEAGSRPAGAPE